MGISHEWFLFCFCFNYAAFTLLILPTAKPATWCGTVSAQHESHITWRAWQSAEWVCRGLWVSYGFHRRGKRLFVMWDWLYHHLRIHLDLWTMKSIYLFISHSMCYVITNWGNMEVEQKLRCLVQPATLPASSHLKNSQKPSATTTLPIQLAESQPDNS